MLQHHSIKSFFSAIAITTVVLLGALSCTKEEKITIDAVEDRSETPGLSVKKITTVISDSGITRYRIVTDRMEVFDQAADPYWLFPEGLYFERFAPDLSVDANFECQQARYLEYQKLWEFKGNVRAINLEGHMLETELLYWDEKQKKIYSDKAFRLTRPTGVSTGVGFETNETMTRWSALQTKSDMYVKEEE